MTLPLFERYPGTTALSVAGIATLPTPLEHLDDLPGIEIGALLVKRDDVTSAVYGGNKVRKLDFLLGHARSEGYRTVLTFGAYGSNHALATAVHARALGIEPHVVLSPQEPGPFAPATLLAHERLGTVLHLTQGWDGRREAVVARRAILERDGIEPYVIPMGGSAPLGVVGYVNAALEVAAQAEGGAPGVVYVAAGTIGTAVGLALGFAAAGADVAVEAIGVTPPELRGVEVARALTADTVALLHALDEGFPALDLDELRLNIRDEFYEPGYGVVTPETTEAVGMASTRGMHLETTYTGKAFSAMLADARAGRLAHERVLFWNTYNSAPYPAPGDEGALPDALRAYIAECRRLYPGA